MLLSQLGELTRQQPARARWVFVPSHALGNTLAERLARDADAWANVRFVTPLDIAIRMAGPFLVERGIDPSDAALGPALVMKLLLDLPAEGGYFRPMGDQPSMADALFRAITELRLCGLRARDLPASAFASPAKHAELTALVAAYERFLADHHVADAAAVYDEAARYPEYCPIAPGDLVVEWPEAIWPTVVRRFLDALPGTRRASDTVAVPGLRPPRRLTTLGASTQPATPAPMCDAARLLHVMEPPVARAHPPAPDGSLTIFHAGGREAELDEVLRRVFASGLSLDCVEIACASEAHALLAWEKATRLEWPVTVSTGIPAPLTRPGRALLAWSDWIDDGFPASRLRRALQSGDVSPEAFRDGDQMDGAMSAGQAARLLLRAEAAWGRDTYAPAFERLRAFYDTRARSEKREVDQQVRDRQALSRLDRLSGWIAALLAASPVGDTSGLVDVQALVAAARAFLSRDASKTSYLDAAALDALDASLAELVALGPARMPPRAALRLVRERVTALQVGRDRARPGHLFITTLANAGLAGRPRLFVVGLEEGRVFPSSVEDPVLLDAERSALHPGLLLAIDRVDEAVFGVVTRLATAAREARNGVCLSFSCRDTREFRETFPSWLVLQAFRVLRGDASLGYGELAEFLGEPVSAVPAAPAGATTSAGWWLAQARVAPVQTEAAALAAYPFLPRGRVALQHRMSPAFTPWDGLVPAAGPLLDPTQQVFAASPSRLEDAARCPFRFFLQKGLGVDALEEEERDRDVWLDRLTRGRLLHELFAETMRAFRDERRRPTSADVPRVLARGDRRLLDLQRELPPPSEEVFQHERDEFLYDLRLFIQSECARPDVDPVAFEVPFGLPPDGDEDDEPLALSSPIEIPLTDGRRLRVHGRIDRVDRLPDGTFETVDYKTGSYWAPDWQGTFAGGSRLQHALYGVAASEMLARRFERPRVARGTYFFPSARGFQRRKEIATPDATVLAEVLQDLANVIAAGTFIQAPRNEACRFCRFAPACGEDPAARAKPKFDLAPELAAYRKLVGHD